MIDLDANTGSAFYQNLTDGDTVLMPVVGLQNIDLQLDELATDATNPENWNAMWLHFEGSKNELDNIAIDHEKAARTTTEAVEVVAAAAEAMDLLSSRMMQMATVMKKFLCQGVYLGAMRTLPQPLCP
jgi:hypothetical protein